MILPAPYRDLSQWEAVPLHKRPADIKLALQVKSMARTAASLKKQVWELREIVRRRDARISALEELLADARAESRLSC